MRGAVGAGLTHVSTKYVHRYSVQIVGGIVRMEYIICIVYFSNIRCFIMNIKYSINTPMAMHMRVRSLYNSMSLLSPGVVMYYTFHRYFLNLVNLDRCHNAIFLGESQQFLICKALFH